MKGNDDASVTTGHRAVAGRRRPADTGGCAVDSRARPRTGGRGPA